jgi:hypothetical protein
VASAKAFGSPRLPEHPLASSASVAHPRRRVPARQRVTDFGRGVTYQIAGLPISIGSIARRGWTPDRILRSAYARRFWSPRNWIEGAHLALALLVWPLVLVGLQISFTLKNGGRIARCFGRPVHRQLVDQLRLYLAAGVLPPWYYIFELHRDPSTTHARAFMYRWESKGGFLRLLKEGGRAPSSELSDKIEFAEQCRWHQLRTPPLMAIFVDGRTELRADPIELDTDLFVKPITGRGGKGAQRWDRAGPGLYVSMDGKRRTIAQLFADLANESNVTPLFAQMRLTNHPELEPLNNGALSTLRLLSCLDELGEPELIGAAMRMAIGDNHVVDNLHAGGIAAAVDLDTGVLGPASNLGADCRLGWIDRHPVSGAPIRGAQLPMWDEVRNLARRAHRALCDRVLVGWDIAITPDGPVLVEGNGNPDLDIMQRFARHGLMAARLGALLAFHVLQLGLDQVPGV